MTPSGKKTLFIPGRPFLSQEDPFCPSSEGKVEIYLLDSVANLGHSLRKQFL